MNARTRVVVISISAPVIAFAIVGGFLGRVMAREDTFQHLKVFDDVVGLITTNYVEPVNVDNVMHGAMRGLADGLDPDSAYLSADQVRQVESRAPLGAGDVGLQLTRQYYLRVVAARDNSPAARAGIRSGDYVRMINDLPTRDMSVWEGMRMLRGAPGSKVTLTVIRGNAADPHLVDLTREAMPASEVHSRIARPGVGYLRIASIGPNAAATARTQLADLAKNGAARLVVDVRQTSTGELDEGLALARLFVGNATLSVREESRDVRNTIASSPGDGTVTLPTVLVIDAGTSGAAELFAAALSGNRRADLVGEHTMGRAAVQRLMRLPDGSGMWLSTVRYLMPNGVQLHEKGLEPTATADEPDVEFGQTPPAGDPVLDKALEHLSGK